MRRRAEHHQRRSPAAGRIPFWSRMRVAERLVDREADREAHAEIGTAVQERVRRAAGVGADDDPILSGVLGGRLLEEGGGELAQRLGSDDELVDRGVRAAIAGAKDPAERSRASAGRPSIG